MPPGKQTYHVEPGREGAWHVRLDAAAQALASFATQKEAVEWLKASVVKSRGVEFLLHRRDGWTRAISGRAKGRLATLPTSPPPPPPPVVYATDEEAEQAAAKVFRLHERLLAELAK